MISTLATLTETVAMDQSPRAAAIIAALGFTVLALFVLGVAAMYRSETKDTERPHRHIDPRVN